MMKERQAASCLAATREVFEEAALKRAAVSLSVELSPFEILIGDDQPEVPDTAELLELPRLLALKRH
jgi:8-oxo-dGTP pyrophosphatase MutT (NUDIX family)